MAARALFFVGMLVAAVGIIDLIWSEASFPSPPGGDAIFRWEVATGPIELFGVGIIIAALAQILAVISRSKPN